MNVAIETSRWWRRQGAYLLGAALLGAWALYAPYREAWVRYARSHPLVPLQAPRGAWTTYEGARWRLLSIAPSDQANLAKETVVVTARFESLIDAGGEVKKINRCQGRLADASGHVWEHDASVELPYDQRKPDHCTYDPSLDTTANFVAGEPWQFEFVFLVPRGTDLHSLHPEIFIPWTESNGAGTYLRFDP